MNKKVFETFGAETNVELDGDVDEEFVHCITEGNLHRGLRAVWKLAKAMVEGGT